MLNICLEVALMEKLQIFVYSATDCYLVVFIGLGYGCLKKQSSLTNYQIMHLTSISITRRQQLCTVSSLHIQV